MAIFMRAIKLIKSDFPVHYDKALEVMQSTVKKIQNGEDAQMLWFLEHHDIYTAGTSANEDDLLDNKGFPVYKTGRGGKHTYHGPGQRVVYVMLDLKVLHNGKPDLRKFVNQMEEWIIESIAAFGIKGERRKGRIGIWVIGKNGDECKIAALGVRVEKWVSYHGIAINLNPKLENYSGIIPCGIKEFGVTSMLEEGVDISIKELDKVLAEKFQRVFGVGLVNV